MMVVIVCINSFDSMLCRLNIYIYFFSFVTYRFGDITMVEITKVASETIEIIIGNSFFYRYINQIYFVCD